MLFETQTEEKLAELAPSSGFGKLRDPTLGKTIRLGMRVSIVQVTANGANGFAISAASVSIVSTCDNVLIYYIQEYMRQ